MKVEYIEMLLVVVIVCIQVWVFARTFMRIKEFRQIMPAVSSLKVSKRYIPASLLETLSPREILADSKVYSQPPAKAMNGSRLSVVVDEDGVDQYEPVPEQETITGEVTDVSIIECTHTGSKVFNNILFSINNYLIRNRGAASDFNLVKDIVERNTGAVEEDINISVSVPLYLGLMGTMIGIVIGLFNMPDLGVVVDTKAKDLLLNDGIALLINGVKIAMIASFWGLLLTIVNSGWVFRGSRSLVEAGKNEFYTFVQIELLPIINNGMAATLQSLQRNLHIFKEDFGRQLKDFSGIVNGLSGVFDASREAIRSQKDLLDAIDNAKVSQIARYNVEVLQQLNVSVNEFKAFNTYLSNVNLFVDNSQQLIGRTNDLLLRTADFKSIAANIDQRLEQSHQLMSFLADHFDKLEAHREYTSNAVADVGHAISASFKDLQQHIQVSSDAVKQFTVDEIDALKKALSESKTNLSNLEHLGALYKDLGQFKNSSASQGERIKQELEGLNERLDKSIAVLVEIEHNSFGYRIRRMFGGIRRLFSSRK